MKYKGQLLSSLLLASSLGCNSPINQNRREPLTSYSKKEIDNAKKTELFFLDNAAYEVSCGKVRNLKYPFNSGYCRESDPNSKQVIIPGIKYTREIQFKIRMALNCIFAPLEDKITFTVLKPESGEFNTVHMGGKAKKRQVSRQLEESPNISYLVDRYTAGGTKGVDVDNIRHDDVIYVMDTLGDNLINPMKFVEVIAHEIGHVLGLYHDMNTTAESFMTPVSFKEIYHWNLNPKQINLLSFNLNIPVNNTQNFLGNTELRCKKTIASLSR